MAKNQGLPSEVGVQENLPNEQISELEAYMNEPDPTIGGVPVVQNLPIDKAADAPVKEEPVEAEPEVPEEIPLEVEAPLDKPVEIVAPTEVLLDLEDEGSTNTEPDWAIVGKETGIDASTKEAVVSQIKALKEQNVKLEAQFEQFKDLATVSDQVSALDNLLKMDAESLMRFKLKEIDGRTPEEVERKILRMIETDTLEDAYDDEIVSIRKERQGIINNASNLRKQQELAQKTQAETLQKTAIDKVKSISKIEGLSFSPENLQKVHSRAERLLVSKEFQDKLKNPDYVAELAFREAVGKSLEKMLESKFKNLAKNEIIKNLGNPTERNAGGIERPKHIEEMGKGKDELKEFAESSEVGYIGR